MIKKNKKGFSLVGVMIAITMIIVGVLAVYALTSSIFKVERISNNRFVATLLAREGIELVRQKRDDNWLDIATELREDPSGDLAGYTWKKGICDGSELPSSTFGIFSMTVTAEPDDCTPEDISDEADSPEPIKITSTVSWNEQGSERSLELIEYLYDWRKTQ